MTRTTAECNSAQCNNHGPPCGGLRRRCWHQSKPRRGDSAVAAPAAGGHLRCLHRSKPRRGESAVAAKAAGGHRWPKGRTPQDPLPRWQATPATIHQQKPHAGFSVLTKPMHRQAEITPLKKLYLQANPNQQQSTTCWFPCTLYTPMSYFGQRRATPLKKQ
jgi:hypothetical protein